MAKLTPVMAHGKQVGWCFFCPACGHVHQFCTAEAHMKGWPIWEIKGSAEMPTVEGSVLNTWDEGEEKIPMCCHLVITDGQINYCSDCTHALAGQTVALPDMSDIPY